MSFVFLSSDLIVSIFPIAYQSFCYCSVQLVLRIYSLLFSDPNVVGTYSLFSFLTSECNLSDLNYLMYLQDACTYFADVEFQIDKYPFLIDCLTRRCRRDGNFVVLRSFIC